MVVCTCGNRDEIDRRRFDETRSFEATVGSHGSRTNREQPKSPLDGGPAPPTGSLPLSHHAMTRNVARHRNGIKTYWFTGSFAKCAGHLDVESFERTLCAFRTSLTVEAGPRPTFIIVLTNTLSSLRFMLSEHRALLFHGSH